MLAPLYGLTGSNPRARFNKLCLDENTILIHHWSSGFKLMGLSGEWSAFESSKPTFIHHPLNLNSTPLILGLNYFAKKRFGTTTLLII